MVAGISVVVVVWDETIFVSVNGEKHTLFWVCIFIYILIFTFLLLFVSLCEVLRPSQQLRSCRACQLPVNTFPGQALTFLVDNQYSMSTPPVVTDKYRWVIMAETTIFQPCPAVSRR